MNALTDAFDFVLQVSQTALQNAYRGMHQARTLAHRYVHCHHSQRVELSIGAPVVTLVTAPSNDGRLRALAKSRVIYHERSLADSGDPGQSAVADIVVRASLEISGGDPAQIQPSTVFIIDWNETTGADITVHGANPALEATVRAALLDFIKAQGANSFGLGALAGVGVSSVSVRALQASSSQPSVLAAGMNLGGRIQGTRAGLQTIFTQQDWALALGKNYVLGQIRDAMRKQLGQIPPPLGTAPVVVSDRIVCTSATPFGCLQEARQRVFLESLDVDLRAGALLFSGAVRQVTDAWYYPTLSATWTAEVTLGIEPNQSLTVTVSESVVQLNEWYAVVADFLTAGLLEGIVRSGVTDVLQAGAMSGGLPGLFSKLLDHLSSLGKTANVGLTPSVTSIEIRPEAIIAHGILGNPTSSPPIAAFAVLATDTPSRLVFYAGESWSPGASIQQYHWTFGDGNSAVLAGTSASFVTQHVYQPGSYQVCLTVTDDRGRSATACRYVYPAILTLEHLPGTRNYNRPLEVCESTNPIPVLFAVRNAGAPVADAVVTVSGNGWQVPRYTDASGQARFELDPNDLRNAGIPRPKPGAWHIGGVRVTATKTGYQQTQAELWMIDCQGLFAAVQTAKAHRDYILDRLAGYAFLEDLIASGALGRQTLDLDLFSRAGAEIGHIVDILTHITQLLEINPHSVQIMDLLGIDPNLDESPALLQKQLERSWNRLNEYAASVDRDYRESRPGEPW